MQQVGVLRRRGYDDFEIGQKIGVTPGWVGLIVGLLERGETRLVAAVESGHLPLSLAVDIARLDDGAAQLALAEAYEQGQIQPARIPAVRRLLSQRERGGRKVRVKALVGAKTTAKPMTGAQLVQIYEKETARQRMLINKAQFTHTRLMFVIEALRDLRGDPSFLAIAQVEELQSLPRSLVARMEGRS